MSLLLKFISARCHGFKISFGTVGKTVRQVSDINFIDQTGYMGALGHAITDVDTGAMLSVKDGEISESTIIDVKIGKRSARRIGRQFY